MKKLFIPMSIVFVFLLSMPAQTQELKTPMHLRIASMDLGSAHYVYGATFAKLWRSILPKGSTIDVLPFAGGLGNAFVIDKGDADLGLLFGAAANWAIQGKVAFPKKIDVLTGLVGGLDKYYAAVMATKRSGDHLSRGSGQEEATRENCCPTGRKCLRILDEVDSGGVWNDL